MGRKVIDLMSRGRWFASFGSLIFDKEKAFVSYGSVC
jgi:hypothetical protein